MGAAGKNRYGKVGAGDLGPVEIYWTDSGDCIWNARPGSLAIKSETCQ